MNYKPINYVLNFIPKNFLTLDDDTDQWLSWALQFYRTLNSHERFEKDLCFIEVKNHKGYLPEGLKKIQKIQLFKQDIPTDVYSSLLQDVTIDDTCPATNSTITETTTTDGDVTIVEKKTIHEASAWTINAALFHTSKLYNDYMLPLRNVGNTSKDYFTKSCYDSLMRSDCYNEFSLSNGCLNTSFKEGVICLEYTREKMDDDNNFIIPAEPPQIWKALANYGIAQYWLNESALGKQNSFSLHERHLQMATNYMKEANGILKLKNISYKTQSAIINDELRILKIPLTWSNKINVYGQG